MDPKGQIDRRMSLTLAKLNLMAGKKYYFVCSSAMRRRAETKVMKSGWDVQIVCLTDES